MAVGKLLLLGGAVVAVAVLASSKKAKAAPAVPPVVAPPLEGGFAAHPEQGGVVIVPEQGEPHEQPPPLVLQPVEQPTFSATSPGFVPPPLGTLPPTIAPAPAAAPPPILPQVLADAAQTLPGASMTLPQVATDILSQAGIPTVVDQGPVPEPVINVPEMVVTPHQEAAQQPTLLHDDTAAVLAKMLAEEATSSWKHVEPLLIPWQAARGLVQDGEFGPKSAKMMAGETGLLPIVRYWPTGAVKSTAVAAYRNDLLALAHGAEEPRATQLVAAAQRETGQGFGTKQGPITTLIHLS